MVEFLLLAGMTYDLFMKLSTMKLSTINVLASTALFLILFNF